MAIEQKRMPEYNRYAKKSLVLGSIILCLFVVFWVSWYLIRLSFRLDIEFLSSFVFFIVFVFLPAIAMLVLAILGVIFGKKGLKSEKVGMSLFGFVVSGTFLLLVLIGVIWSIIYFATGGEIM